MASRCEALVHAPDEASARAWSDAAIAEVRRIETKYSRYRDDSVTTAINRAAGGAAIAVDEETAALLDFGAELYAQSDGLFDLSSGVLRRAWDFKLARLPDPSELDRLLELVGWSQLEWRAPRCGCRAPAWKSTSADRQEYAADRAATAMAERGAVHGLVNLGGDVRVLGPRPDGSPWRISIQDPRGSPGATVAHLEVPRGALATSGDYERYFELDGRRYCHLLDPRSGWPVAFWRSVSVVAPVCVAAGACATIAMLKPVDEALAFLGQQGLRYLAIDSAGERHAR
jgi:thiamine biosynthesis lipoprotein